ncbi:MAG: FAD-dependent oxidoreductase [Anaerolineaceae bacterium]|nr:FAD-dependent oxidoreductase [Anaerolineaceae bacterium]
MRDIVIIGGGLSGLSAAYELEQLGVPYRLIEVKKRLGGSLMTTRREGFLMDDGPFAFHLPPDWPLLTELGLSDALYTVTSPAGKPWQAFKGGTASLTDALAQRLTGTVIRRMAVSSIGQLDNRFTLCMENGLMWDAGALIVAAPARHVERMFRTLRPAISERLLDYPYDTILRVAFGVQCEAFQPPGKRIWDMAIPYYYETDHPERVPPGGLLLQLAFRCKAGEMPTPDALLATLRRRLKLPEVITSAVTYWPEADPLAPFSPGHEANMAAIESQLPEGVALIGSDYSHPNLATRVEQGRAAARRIAAWAAGG